MTHLSCAIRAINVRWRALLIVPLVFLVLPLSFSESKEPVTPTVHQILLETVEATNSLRSGLQLELWPQIALLQGLANDGVAARSTLARAKAFIFEAKEWKNDDEMLVFIPDLLAIALTQGKLRDESGQTLTIKQAVTLIESASDKVKQLVALGTLASTYIQLGDLHRAMQPLSWAIQVVTNAETVSLNDDMVRVRLHMAQAFAEHGHPIQAIKMIWDVLEMIKQWGPKDLAGFPLSYQLKEAGRILAKTKDVEALQRFVKIWREQKDAVPTPLAGKDIEDLLWLSEIFLDAGDKQTATYYLAQARTRTQNNQDFSLPFIEDPMRYLDLLVRGEGGLYDTLAGIWSRIAVQEARLGNLNGAHEAETSIPLIFDRGHSLLDIVEIQLQNGAVTEARQTAAQTESSYTLGRIVVAQAQDGDVEGAINSFERLEYLLDSDSDLQQYLARLKSTEYPPTFLKALRTVAKARILAGDVAETVAWAHRQPTPYKKTYALLGVAEGLLEEKQGPLEANLSIQGCSANPSPGRYF